MNQHTRGQPRRRGFSRMDALGLVLLLIAVIAILLPALNAGLMRDRALYSIKHMRGIHSGMVMFSSGNKDFYPGFDSNGNPSRKSVAARAGVYGTASTDGRDVVYRLTLLLRGNFFSPEYLLSPFETDPDVTVPQSNVNMLPGRNYSFAMRNIAQIGTKRNEEWRATNNSKAAIISDRNIGGPGSAAGILSTKAQSIHTGKGNGWSGGVIWNDNHGTYETTDQVYTENHRYGVIALDGLFSDVELTDQSIGGADAAMVFKDNVSYHGQTAK